MSRWFNFIPRLDSIKLSLIEKKYTLNRIG